MNTVNVKEASAAVSGGRALLVDVRSAEERQVVAPEGAIHIPLEEVPSRVGELLGKGPVYFICRSGGRSAMAAELARSQGVDAWNVSGGMNAWVSAGLPVLRAPGSTAGFVEGKVAVVAGGVLIAVAIVVTGTYVLFGCPTVVCGADDVSSEGVMIPLGLLAPKEFAASLSDRSLQLIDVRTDEEYRGGHIAGAALIDFRSPAFRDQAIRALDPSRPVYLYCRTGNRSGQATAMLRAEGFKVADLSGGIVAWEAAGLPLER